MEACCPLVDLGDWISRLSMLVRRSMKLTRVPKRARRGSEVGSEALASKQERSLRVGGHLKGRQTGE